MSNSPIKGLNQQSSSTFKIFEVNNLDIEPISKNEVKTKKKCLETNNKKKKFQKLRQVYSGIDEDWEQKMQKVTVLPYSESVWDISPPSMRKLKKILQNKDTEFYMTARWSFLR